MEWMEPMEPVLTDSVVSGDEWVHQIKWDGIRGLCYVDREQVRLFTRSGRERIRWYPEISEIAAMLDCSQAILDGELIVMNDEGRPSFHHIMSRERVKREDRLLQYQKKFPVQYMVFDILYRDGKDLRKTILSDRKRILDESLRENGLIRVVSDYSDGDSLFRAMKEKNMEGIVSKRLTSPYIAGKKHRDWFKTKIVKRLLAVVCGLKMKKREIQSLILGVYEGQKLKPVGNVSSGLSHQERTILLNALPQLSAAVSPFEKEKAAEDVIWLKPVLTVVVSFMEREPQGGLRHPVLVGFSPRKPSEADGKEEPV